MVAPADNTPLSIINDAFFDAGYTQEGQDANSEQVVRGTRRLKDLINVEQTQGVKLWLNEDISIPLVTGQRTYTLSPTGNVVMAKPTRAMWGYYLDINSQRTPIRLMGWEEYTRLANITQLGPINSFFVDKKKLELGISMWLVPDATTAAGTVHLVVQNQVENFIDVEDDMDFPIEWRMYLRWGLAEQISIGQPEAIMNRCSQMAERYRVMLEDWDVEDASTSFKADVQGAYGNPYNG